MESIRSAVRSDGQRTNSSGMPRALRGRPPGGSRQALWHNAAPMRLFALRGANSVESNEAQAILDATDELMRELMERNQLEPESLVSVIFTMTDDLNAEFPAVAARQMGWTEVPLSCMHELDVPCTAFAALIEPTS